MSATPSDDGKGVSPPPYNTLQSPYSLQSPGGIPYPQQQQPLYPQQQQPYAQQQQPYPQQQHGFSVQVTQSQVVGAHQQRVLCAYCQQSFVTKGVSSHLARCPHCSRVSSIGTEFIRIRGTIFLTIGLVFLLAGTLATVFTYEMARENGGIYVVWVGAFIAGILNILRGVLYFTLYKVSHPME